MAISLLSLLFFAQHIFSATAKIHTGFCYGAFWNLSTPKTTADFKRAFTEAQNLPNTPGKFNSARLFTSKQWNTINDPISAFEAAIDTNTTLLLGLWITTKGHRKSFHTLRKVSTATVASGGPISGNRMLSRMRKRPAPSIRAASSSSTGSEMKNCRSR